MIPDTDSLAQNIFQRFFLNLSFPRSNLGLYVFLLLYFLCLLLLSPRLVLYPTFLSSVAGAYLFLIPSLYENTASDLATPKSGSLHAYFAFLLIFELVMFVFINKSSATAFVPYSPAAHSLLWCLLLLLAFSLYTRVNNQDGHSKRRFVRSLRQIFPFLVLMHLSYAHLLFFAEFDPVAAEWIRGMSVDPNGSFWQNPAIWYKFFKSAAQIGCILGWLGAVIATLVFLNSQRREAVVTRTKR